MKIIKTNTITIINHLIKYKYHSISKYKIVSLNKNKNKQKIRMINIS